MTNPLDLRELFGERFRVGHDECVGTDGGSKFDPWMYELRGRRARIYPHSRTHVGVEVIGPGGKLTRLLADAGFVLHQDGDDGKTYLAEPARLTDEMLALMRLPKRRHLSPERKAEQVERLKSFRFQPGTQASGEFEGTYAGPGPQDDPEAA